VWLSVLAYNLGNLWRRLALPARIANWSLTSSQQRRVKTGGEFQFGKPINATGKSGSLPNPGL
jgi:hypothetical protein